MNEPKCRAPSLSASHVSSSNTAESANIRISEQRASYI